MTVNGIVLAAGLSSRMKEFKPLMKIGTKTMVETVVDRMQDARVGQIMVVTGYRGEEIRQVLTSDRKRKRVCFACNPQYETTQMLDSVKIGLEAMDRCDWFFVTPGDMPAIGTDTYRKLMAMAGGYRGKVIFPLMEGRRKHPPLVRWNCRKDILKFSGNGLRELWKQYEGEILEVPIEDKGCRMDVDLPGDYWKVCQYMLLYR